ncbi:MAG: hypothetical protein PWP64_853, partial [Candidatus Cloacimonadota bacterium]|nr:hypothetical protein [Candidatus Cloacimonadota bacterium]
MRYALCVIPEFRKNGIQIASRKALPPFPMGLRVVIR